GIRLAIAAYDSMTISSCYVGLGTNLQQQGRIDSALNYYFKALRIAESIEYSPLIITCKLNIATIYYDHQPNNLRIKDFLELLRISREIGDTKREMSILEWLGYLK